MVGSSPRGNAAMSSCHTTQSLWGERLSKLPLPRDAGDASLDDRAVLEAFDGSPTRAKSVDALHDQIEEIERREDYLKSLVDTTKVVTIDPRGPDEFGESQGSLGVEFGGGPGNATGAGGAVPGSGGGVGAGGSRVSSATSTGITQQEVPTDELFHQHQMSEQNVDISPADLSQVLHSEVATFDAQIHNQVNNGLLRNRNFVSHSTNVSCLDAKLWYMRQNALLQKYNLKLSEVAHAYDDVLNNLKSEIDFYADAKRHFFDLRKTAYATAHGLCPIRLPEMEQKLRDCVVHKKLTREDTHDELKLDTIVVHGAQKSIFNSVFLVQTTTRKTDVGRDIEQAEVDDRMTQIYAQNKHVFGYNRGHFLNQHGQAYRRTDSGGRQRPKTETDFEETLTKDQRSAVGALLDDDLPHDLAGEEEIAAQHDEADHALRLRSGTIAGAALESRNSGGSPGSGSPAGSQAVFSPGGTRHSRGSSKGELVSEVGAGVSRDVSGGGAAAAGPPHHSSTSGVLEDATLSQNPLAGQNAPATIN
eukprot:g1911.t1